MGSAWVLLTAGPASAMPSDGLGVIGPRAPLFFVRTEGPTQHVLPFLQLSVDVRVRFPADARISGLVENASVPSLYAGFSDAGSRRGEWRVVPHWDVRPDGVAHCGGGEGRRTPWPSCFCPRVTCGLGVFLGPGGVFFRRCGEGSCTR